MTTSNRSLRLLQFNAYFLKHKSNDRFHRLKQNTRQEYKTVDKKISTLLGDLKLTITACFTTSDTNRVATILETHWAMKLLVTIIMFYSGIK